MAMPDDGTDRREHFVAAFADFLQTYDALHQRVDADGSLLQDEHTQELLREHMRICSAIAGNLLVGNAAVFLETNGDRYAKGYLMSLVGEVLRAARSDVAAATTTQFLNKIKAAASTNTFTRRK